MDVDDTQARAALTAGDLMAHAVLMAGVVTAIALVMVLAGCVVQVRQEDAPELAKLVDTDEPPVVSITRDGDSKDAQISIPAK